MILPKTRRLEDITLIGLTFGGYLRSKVLLPITFLHDTLIIILEGVVMMIV